MTSDAAVRVRWPALDIARGLAIVAMVVYHLAWDLSFLELVSVDVIGHPGWRLFARTIAASFLVLVGIGLCFAHGRGVRWTPFARRLATIGAAALAITAATRIAMPDEYIFFGILHCIAVSSVLALAFLQAPAAVLVAAALACFAAPLVLTDPALDGPLLDWLGLGAALPSTNDYVPIFPWFAFVLLGLLAGRLARPFAARAASPSWLAGNPVGRSLIWSGRWSLFIYLLHQPILFGALFLLAQVMGPSPAAEEASFQRTCEASCVESGTGATRCALACACAADRLKTSDLWRKAITGGSDASDQGRIAAETELCFRAPPEGPAP